MYIIKQGLNKKEKQQIKYILYDIVDLYGDFYSTRENIRISLRDNADELFDYLKKGSKIVYELDKETGLALILKEKGFRTYIKILTKDEKTTSNLLKMINWNIKENIFVKLHKNNNLIKIFQRNGYSFQGNRGSEVLLSRTYVPRPESRNTKDEEQYESKYKKII